MKRSGFKFKPRKPMKRCRLRVKGVSTTAQDKDDVQDLVREIVIKRDKGCIFRKEKGHVCSGYTKDGRLILQADHLVSRANSSTYADTRLIVCVCKGIHGWKSVGNNLRKAEYDERLKKLLPKEIVELWEKYEQDFRSHKTYKPDWKLAILALNQELKSYAN